MVENKCTSCKKSVLNIKGSTRFKCPGCTEVEIIRCFDCRMRGTKYRCGKCDFEGPN